MPYASLALPQGVYRRGTEYQSKGRVYDASLVRWYGPSIGPIGGWASRATTTLTGVPRAIVTWKDNSYGRWAAVGTHSKLYAINSAQAAFDITPSPFTAGRANQTAKTGYGYGVCGAGTYGTARPDTGAFLPATVWDLDNWGQYLVGCADSDGKLYQWTLSTGTPAATITNAPTGCNGLVVTAERSLMALGASSNPRLCKWSDLEDNTVWSPSSTNKAGDFELQTSGSIQCGRRLPDQTLILTDLDAWVAEYKAGVYVYGFRKVGDDCGAISRGCICLAGPFAVWWGPGGFWAYDGAIRPISCDVLEYVLGNLNPAQRTKVTAFHNVKYSEVWWFYPSSNSTECDSYVVWKYPTATDPVGTWNIGTLGRTCGAEQGVFTYPIMLDSTGSSYDHERGSSYGSSEPYFIAGPVEIGSGDRVMHATKLIPDEATVGTCTVNFRTRIYPNATETVTSDITLDSTGVADTRFSARQAELEVTFDADGAARWGSPRLLVSEGGRR